MKVNNVLDIFGGILLIALVTDILSSKNTAADVTAVGKSFAGLINSALGKG